MSGRIDSFFDPAIVACQSFEFIPWNGGAKDVEGNHIATTGKVRMMPDLGMVRELVGDTDGTIAAIKEHNAVYEEMCNATEDANSH